MCLILFAYKAHPRYPLILAANRDEFYARPTERVHFWEDRPDVLAGRDLKYGGTWMGITRSGRFAAVTNYRDRTEFREHPLSRGLMVRDYLTGFKSPDEFIDGIVPRDEEYNGFNLLAGDNSSLVYYSNRSRIKRTLDPGIYGLSNHLLDTPWPKVARGRRAIDSLLKETGPAFSDRILEMLSDTTRARDEELPDTGFGAEWERILSSPFITSPVYGTRCSTALLIDTAGRVDLTERSYSGPDDHGDLTHHEFGLDEPWLEPGTGTPSA